MARIFNQAGWTFVENAKNPEKIALYCRLFFERAG
jgi:hypothetical protein